jgi:hypothetical protein
VIRYLEVPMQHVGRAANVDDHRCSLGERCCAEPAAPLGWTLDESDDGPYRCGWNTPFTPEGVDEADVSAWVCEDCASWLEDMHALLELIEGLL